MNGLFLSEATFRRKSASSLAVFWSGELRVGGPVARELVSTACSSVAVLDCMLLAELHVVLRDCCCILASCCLKKLLLLFKEDECALLLLLRSTADTMLELGCADAPYTAVSIGISLHCLHLCLTTTLSVLDAQALLCQSSAN